MELLERYNASLHRPIGYYSRTLLALDPDLTTQYPSTITGTPTDNQNPGGAPKNYDQQYDSNDTYLENINNGKLRNTLKITNLDVQNPSVQGGPNTDITTNYPPTVTGTPTSTQNPGGPINHFNHPYSPNNTYLANNPIAGVSSGELSNTLPITNLDVEEPGVQGGPNADIVTNYPKWNTGTPNEIQNPGAAPQRFDPKWSPNNEYLLANPIAGINSGVQYNVSRDPDKKNSLKITNLDTTEPGVQGGIPYNQILDPTIYPPTTNHTSPIKGWFAQPSSASSKFYQYYSENNTYVDFISSYT